MEASFCAASAEDTNRVAHDDPCGAWRQQPSSALAHCMRDIAILATHPVAVNRSKSGSFGKVPAVGFSPAIDRRTPKPHARTIEAILPIERTGCANASRLL
jgi:hypothetical protein